MSQANRGAKGDALLLGAVCQMVEPLGEDDTAQPTEGDWKKKAAGTDSTSADGNGMLNQSEPPSVVMSAVMFVCCGVPQPPDGNPYAYTIAVVPLTASRVTFVPTGPMAVFSAEGLPGAGPPPAVVKEERIACHEMPAFEVR